MPAKTTPQPENWRNPTGSSAIDWVAYPDPLSAAAQDEVRRLSVGEDGALAVKVQACVVLGIMVSRGLQYGVEAHMRRTLAHGVATVPGGCVAWSVGVRALRV